MNAGDSISIDTGAGVGDAQDRQHRHGGRQPTRRCGSRSPTVR